jgi:hypothetical protein
MDPTKEMFYLRRQLIDAVGLRRGRIRDMRDLILI